MLRIIFISSVLLFILGRVNAQSFPEKKQFKIGAGLEYVMPLGKQTSTLYSNGVAVPMELRYGMFDDIAVVLSTSYLRLNSQSVEDEYLYYHLPRLEAVLIEAGFQYQLQPFYIKLSAGPVLVTRPHPTTALALSPAIGITYKKLDFSLSASKWTRPYEVDYLGFRISYFF